MSCGLGHCQVNVHKARALLYHVVHLKDDFLANALLQVLREQELALPSDRWRVHDEVQERFQTSSSCWQARHQLDHAVSEIVLVIVREYDSATLTALFVAHLVFVPICREGCRFVNVARVCELSFSRFN